VGVKSSAVPITTTSTIMMNMSSVLLSRNGSSSLTTSPGMLATVISHALTMAAATRNITTAVVLPAARMSPYNSRSFSSR